ncbi:MAG: DUF2309 family protein, partial [Bdellovibrionales bacterium]|nr:DUF2309 family protein [Bdellovibrionales bacterium]
MGIDEQFLNEVARDLPIIRPIKEFIHLNLLLPYQHLPFWEALEEVSRKLEAHPFSELSHYRKKIQEGELPLELLKKRLASLLPEDKCAEALSFICEGDFKFTYHDLRVGTLHDCWNDILGVNVIQMA